MKQENVLNKKFTKGFTLIELLVVVLIIGVLAAIALPQYKKAVLRSKFAAIKDITRVIYEAEQRYYLANNQYTTNWNDLDITVDTNNCTINAPYNYILCSLKDKQNKLLLQYLIMPQTQQRRCDAWPGDENSLTNQICKIETGKNTPYQQCGSYCIYYY